MGHRRLRYSKTLEDAYNIYKKGRKTKDRLTRNQGVAVWNAFEEYMVKSVIEKGLKWELPYRIGDFFISKSYLPFYVNIGESIRQRKRVYTYNDHTQGYAYSSNLKRLGRSPVVKEYKVYSTPMLAEKITDAIWRYADNDRILPVYQIYKKRKRKKNVKKD